MEGVAAQPQRVSTLVAGEAVAVEELPHGVDAGQEVQPLATAVAVLAAAAQCRGRVRLDVPLHTGALVPLRGNRGGCRLREAKEVGSQRKMLNFLFSTSIVCVFYLFILFI